MWARFGRSLHVHLMALWCGDHDLRLLRPMLLLTNADDYVRAAFDLCSSPGHEGSKSIWRLGVRPDLSIRPGQTCLIYIYICFFNIIFWFRPILILFFFTLSTTSVKKELVWGKTHDGERRRGPIRKLWTYTLAILSSCITGWAKRPASWTGNWRRERGDQGRVSALLLFFFGGPFI